MGIQVGRWDCRYCGHVGNLGPETKCAGCGAPRDPDVKFYLPEDAEYVADENRLKQARAGVDWNCDHCGADNKAGTNICRSCGNPRTEEDESRRVVEYGLDEVPHSDRDTRPKKEEKQQPEPEKAKKKMSRTGCIGCLVVVLAIIGLLGYLLWPHDTIVTVAGLSWERTIEIEQRRPVKEDGWSLPAGATLIRKYRDIHHYDKVLDHYENRTKMVKVKVGEERYVCGKKDLGNGYFEDKYCTRPKYEQRKEEVREPVYRKEPVYKTKYEYTVFKWLKDHTNKADGKQKPARWPEGPPQGKDWRAGKKTETYTVHMKDDKGDIHDEKVNFAYGTS